MATLKEIKNKLRAVTNIQKITKAMEMVAASRLKKAQAKAERSRPYFAHLQMMLERQAAAADEFAHPFLESKEVKKICFIIIAGDRGLCGSYNQSVLSQAEKTLKKYDPNIVELILVGKKAVNYFAHKKWKITERVTDWGGKLTYQEVKLLAQQLMAKYLHHSLDEILLIYTHYISAIKRKIVVEQLLPIKPTSDAGASMENYIIEPDIKTILTQILPHYIITKIQTALNESYASELAARVFSMRAATNNASELIEKLTLVRNQLRQSSITRELVEITSCVESLK